MGCSQSKKKGEDLKVGQDNKNINDKQQINTKDGQLDNHINNNIDEDDWIQKMKRDIQNQ